MHPHACRLPPWVHVSLQGMMIIFIQRLIILLVSGVCRLRQTGSL
jgi:hypothetical protein